MRKRTSWQEKIEIAAILLVISQLLVWKPTRICMQRAVNNHSR
jgi:hypothetical protein